MSVKFARGLRPRILFRFLIILAFERSALLCRMLMVNKAMAAIKMESEL
jgi:hypothetical protein